jgi:hypothetical protein
MRYTLASASRLAPRPMPMATPVQQERADERPDDSGGATFWSRIRRWWLPLLAGLLCIAGLVTLYTTASLNGQPGTSQAARGVPVALGTGFPPELGVDGHLWQWMGSDAGMTLRGGDGPYWVGFRAHSLRTPRTLTFGDRDGGKRQVRVGTGFGAYVAGPFMLKNGIALDLQASPGARRAAHGDPRKVAIQISDPRTFRRPIAVLPSAGFYQSEGDSRGYQFNWLYRKGNLLVSGPVAAKQAWVTLRLQSVDTTRHLAVSGPGLSTQVTVPSHGAFRIVTLGPVSLHGGRATLQLTAKEPPRRYGQDDRLLSVQVQAGAGFTPSASG